MLIFWKLLTKDKTIKLRFVLPSQCESKCERDRALYFFDTFLESIVRRFHFALALQRPHDALSPSAWLWPQSCGGFLAQRLAAISSWAGCGRFILGERCRLLVILCAGMQTIASGADIRWGLCAASVFVAPRPSRACRAEWRRPADSA